MAPLSKIGSACLHQAERCWRSACGKTVDWCRYFQWWSTHCHWLVDNTSLDFFQAAHNYVQAQFTFVVCGIKRSSHAFCPGPAKLAQSLYCRCASSRAHHQNNQNNGTMSTRILGVIAGNRVWVQNVFQSTHRDFYSALFWCKVGSEQFLARYRGLIGCY